MPTWLLIVLALVFLVTALAAFGFAVLAGADPEGRGGDFALTGLGASVLALIAFVIFAVWALLRALGVT